MVQKGRKSQQITERALLSYFSQRNTTPMGLTKAAEQVEGEIRSHVGRRKVTALLRTRVWRYNSEERATQVLPRPGLRMSFCVSWSQAPGRVGGCGLPAAGSYQQEEEPVCPALRSAAATAAVWLLLPHVSPAVLESPLQPLLSTECWSLPSGSPGFLLPSLLRDHLPACSPPHFPASFPRLSQSWEVAGTKISEIPSAWVL